MGRDLLYGGGSREVDVRDTEDVVVQLPWACRSEGLIEVVDDTVRGVDATKFGVRNSCSKDTGRSAVLAGAGVVGCFISCPLNVGTGRTLLRGDLAGNALYDRVLVRGKCG